MRKYLVSHPTGNQNVRGVLAGLHDSEALLEFHTGFAWFNDRNSTNLSRRLLSVLAPRTYENSYKELTKIYPKVEAIRVLKQKIGGYIGSIQYGSVEDSYDYIDKKVAKRLLKCGPEITDVFLSPNGGSVLETMKAAKKRGKRVTYELVLGYWREAEQVLGNLALEYPEWAPTIPMVSTSESGKRRLDEELSLADRVIVASEYTLKTLNSFPGSIKELKMIPYGYPEVRKDNVKISTGNAKQLNVLYTGALSQRKGIKEVFECATRLSDKINLTVIGAKIGNNSRVLDQHLKNVHWHPSLPHSEVLEEMRKADILLFPSHFEGFGLVITEAMSTGTPVITTKRTAGASIIRDGIDGWITEPGDVGHMVDILEDLLGNPKKLARVSSAALLAAEGRPWSQYGSEIAKYLLE
ncbi:glycosyltransferase family 4 protein [Roseibacillus persicicus]|nr:glycosyltransferase family 4 protein [Roseibacillus persicicus]